MDEKAEHHPGDILGAPVDDMKPEVDEIELAKDENDYNYTAAEERRLIRKVCISVSIPCLLQFASIIFSHEYR